MWFFSCGKFENFEGILNGKFIIINCLSWFINVSSFVCCFNICFLFLVLVIFLILIMFWLSLVIMVFVLDCFDLGILVSNLGLLILRIFDVVVILLIIEV